jgi:hypothetical protein
MGDSTLRVAATRLVASMCSVSDPDGPARVIPMPADLRSTRSRWTGIGDPNHTGIGDPDRPPRASYESMAHQLLNWRRMQLARHMFALLLVGCFRSHGPDLPGAAARDGGTNIPLHDAARAPDGAACREAASSDLQLRCPDPFPAGANAVVHVEATAPFCCPDSAARVRTHNEGGATRIDVTWDTCECCEECGCVGGHIEGDIDLGPIAPSEVRAGGQSCAITTQPGSFCTELEVGLMLLPSAVFAGEEIPMYLRSDAFVCDCRPRATFDSAVAHLQACDCGCEEDCDACGYDATLFTPARPVGRVRLGPTFSSAEVRVVDPVCTETATLTNVAVMSPAHLYASADGGVWLALDVAEQRCCGEPALVVHSQIEGNEIRLSLCEAEPDPCDCLPSGPTLIRTYHYAGSLPPGGYNVISGSLRFPVTVSTP